MGLASGNHPRPLSRSTAAGRLGDLDPGFGSGGKVTTAIGAGLDEGHVMTIDANGKLVVVGSSHNGTDNDFAVARYNSDGTLDSSFGSGDIVTTAVGPGIDSAYAIAIDGSGKIVVAGFSSNGANNDFALVRYGGVAGPTLDIADANLDASYGSFSVPVVFNSNGAGIVSASCLFHPAAAQL
ncbi:MAG: delta-60 repeat domain-containing protein [Caldilineaceae bacterium]